MKSKLDRSNLEQQVRELENRSRSASIAGETNWFEEFASDDYLSIDPVGELSDKRQALESRRAAHMKFHSLEVDDVRIRIYGDTAVVTGRSWVKGQHRGTHTSGNYRYTRVYIQKKGRWQLVSSQSTRIAA